MSLPDLPRTPAEKDRRAALTVAARATDPDDLCELLHALGITDVNGRRVLNAPRKAELPRRACGRIDYRAAKSADAVR